MANRNLPYSAFNFVVDFGDGVRDPDSARGGFSEVSGLGTELTVAEYRNGNDPENRVRKVPGIHKVSDVTLKRGVIDSSDFYKWIAAARRNVDGSRRNVKITLRDEDGNDVQRWVLQDALPLKYTGPTLQAKGGGDVSVEELVLSAEGFMIES